MFITFVISPTDELLMTVYQKSRTIEYETTKRVDIRGLSGYQAHRQVADSRGPVLVAGLSLNK